MNLELHNRDGRFEVVRDGRVILAFGPVEGAALSTCLCDLFGTKPARRVEVEGVSVSQDADGHPDIVVGPDGRPHSSASVTPPEAIQLRNLVTAAIWPDVVGAPV